MKQNTKPTKHNHTPFSNIVGSLGATYLETTALHPIDTVAKSKMANTASSLRQATYFNQFKRLYKGYALNTTKKSIMRGLYKWPAQREFYKLTDTYFGSQLQNKYGNKKAEFIKSGISGMLTGLCEPLISQPFDTLQVRQQALGNQATKLTVKNIKNLGFTGLWRGAFITGLLRNSPGGFAMFGTAKGVNILFNNENRRNIPLDLFAKWCGAAASILAAQPGDVIKTGMQVNNRTFRAACAQLSIRDIFTRGITPRLAISVKVGIGFFLAEKCMDKTADLINGKEETRNICPYSHN